MPENKSKPFTKEVIEVLRKVQSGDISILKETIAKYPSLHWTNIYYEKTGDTIMHCVSRLGLVDIMEYILANFSPKAVDCKNRDDKTSLHEAAQFAHCEACTKLLEHGANVNALKRADWTPLMLACTKINKTSLKTVEVLLQHGAIVNYKNKDGWTALHLICREGDIDVLNLLHQFHLDLQIKTKNGRTAMHIAALHGHKNIIENLISLGLSVNDTDNCGNTPLHEAVLGRHVDVCKILIKNKADIHCKNNGDYSLLHLAACEGYVDVINFIINEVNFDVNICNKHRLRPLHCAARKGQKEAYNFLVKNGASEDVKDNFNRLPIDYF